MTQFPEVEAMSKTTAKIMNRILEHRRKCPDWKKSGNGCFDCHCGLLGKMERELIQHFDERLRSALDERGYGVAVSPIMPKSPDSGDNRDGVKGEKGREKGFERECSEQSAVTVQEEGGKSDPCNVNKVSPKQRNPGSD